MNLETLPGKPIIGPETETMEWYEARMTCFGASDASAVCGLSPWRQPLDIYLEKKGCAPPREETAAMRLGKRLEPVVLAEYETMTGAAVITRLPMMFAHDLRYIGATPDAIRAEGEIIPVEAKTCTWRRAHEFGDEWTDDIPADYVMQTQSQMFVLGANECHLPVLIDGRTMRIYRVMRHEELIQHYLAAAKELWERILNSDPPEPNWQHPRSLDLVKSLYKDADGSVALLDRDAETTWGEFQALGDEIKALQEERDAKKAKVLYSIGAASVGMMPDGDIELVRSIVNRKAYEVRESSYIQLRQRKVKSR